MRRPPRTFQDVFRRSVVQAFNIRNLRLNIFIDDSEYGEFLSDVLPTCSFPRQILAEFGYRIVAKASTRYRATLCLAIIQFCIELGEIDGIENADQPLAALKDLDFAKPGEISRWIDAYCHGFRASR